MSKQTKFEDDRTVSLVWACTTVLKKLNFEKTGCKAQEFRIGVIYSIYIFGNNSRISNDSTKPIRYSESAQDVGLER